MQDYEDYYQILDIPPDATADQIRDAHLYWANVLHPDRLMGVSERIRRRAEGDLKKVNRAYDVLSNPQKRQQYDAQHFKKRSGVSDRQRTTPTIMPQPGVYPAVIRFDNVVPHVKQAEVFFARNTGGPCSKVLLSTTPPWIKVVETAPLQRGSKFPMRVRIEAVGVQWATTYSADIAVKLDEAVAKVRVELRTKAKPKKRLW